MLVATSLFWCSGSWNLTCKQISQLRDLQQAMLQKMFVIRRRPLEPMCDFMRRWRSKIKQLKIRHSIDWERHYHRSVFKRGGHVARIVQYHPTRVTYRALKHKDWESIQVTALQNSGDQLHGRKVHVWRWERPLYKNFGDDSWQQAAQHKLSWTSCLEEMVHWRCAVQ